jgi:hypothetical protein
MLKLWFSVTNDETVTVSFARRRLVYVEKGREVADRDGVVNRITTAKERFPSHLALVLPKAEALTRSGSGQALGVYLRAAFEHETIICIFDSDGGRAYQAVLVRADDALLAGDERVDGDGDFAGLVFFVVQDGAYAHWDSLEDISWRSRT